MADEDLARLVTTLEVRTANFEKKLKAANSNSRRNANAIQRKFDKANKGVSSSFQRHFSSAARSVAVIDGPLGGVAGRLTSVGSLAGGAGAGFAVFSAGIAGATFAAYKALDAFQELETQQLVTEQVLRATGYSAGQTASSVEALSQSVGMTTLASITGARKASAQLLTFRSIAGETFERTLRVSQDLATVGFGSLESSAKQLGKALEDPRTGLTQLKRVGVSFSEAQKQVIYDLYDTGRTAEAQSKILDALERQVGGAGAASGQGLAGAYDTLSEATQLLLERWGSQIAQAINLRSAIMGIAGAIDAVNQRASIGGQLHTVNEQIVEHRRRATEQRSVAGIPGMDNPFTNGGDNLERRQEEAELNRLLAERHRLQMQMFREGEQLSQASLAALEAQKQAEKERADSAIVGLEKEIETAKLSNEQRRIAEELAKAGVTAETEAGKQIVANVQELFRVEEAARQARKDDKSRDKSTQVAAREQEAVAELIDTLQFEISILGLTEREQAVMNSLRLAGAAATEEQIAKIRELTGLQFDRQAALDREKLTMENLRDLGKDVLSGFAQDMRNGVTEAEALANALQKVIDKLLDSAFDTLSGFLFGGSGGGGLGSIVSSVLGIGGGPSQLQIAMSGAPGVYHTGGIAGRPRQTKNVNPAVFAGAPRYHNGGIAGYEPLKPDEVPAILQRGEPIIPKSMANLRNSASSNAVVTVQLVDDSGRMASIANQQIETSAGTIIFKAVEQSRQVAADDFRANLQSIQKRG